MARSPAEYEKEKEVLLQLLPIQKYVVVVGRYGDKLIPLSATEDGKLRVDTSITFGGEVTIVGDNVGLAKENTLRDIYNILHNSNTLSKFNTVEEDDVFAGYVYNSHSSRYEFVYGYIGSTNYERDENGNIVAETIVLQDEQGNEIARIRRAYNRDESGNIQSISRWELI